jgi:hypothetical protein
VTIEKPSKSSGESNLTPTEKLRWETYILNRRDEIITSYMPDRNSCLEALKKIPGLKDPELGMPDIAQYRNVQIPLTANYPSAPEPSNPGKSHRKQPSPDPLFDYPTDLRHRDFIELQTSAERVQPLLLALDNLKQQSASTFSYNIEIQSFKLHIETNIPHIDYIDQPQEKDVVRDISPNNASLTINANNIVTIGFSSVLGAKDVLWGVGPRTEGPGRLQLYDPTGEDNDTPNKISLDDPEKAAKRIINTVAIAAQRYGLVSSDSMWLLLRS